MRDRIEDLSVHARRGELGEAGLRQLAMALRSSHEARLLHDAGCQFDRADSILPGDDAIARRVVHRVMSSRQRAHRKHGRRLAQVILASFAWTAAAAAAAPLLVGSEVIKSAPVAALRRPINPAISPMYSSSAAPAPVMISGNPHRVEAPAPEPPTKVAGAPDKQAKSRPAQDRVTREQSFAEANRLRRLGRTSEAISQYLSLQGKYPGTAEARNADITLGMLRLQSGSPGAALVHFRRYLEHNSGSPMIPEALYGEAQALDALGQRAAALRSYASLLKRFPDSAYANTSRAKLQKSP